MGRWYRKFKYNSDSLLASIRRQSTGVFHYVCIYMHFEPPHDKLKIYPPALEHILALVDDIVAEYASDFQMIINLKQTQKTLSNTRMLLTCKACHSNSPLNIRALEQFLPPANEVPER